MVKRKPKGVKAPRLTVDQAERKRISDAKYHSQPDYIEKQRTRMAERRAAVKERRRQWDPPKKVRARLPTVPTDASALGEEASDTRSLTSAERCAITALSGMADTRETDDQVTERGSALAARFGGGPEALTEGDLLAELNTTVPEVVAPSLYSGATPSPPSSVVAVDEAPIRRPKSYQTTWLEASRHLPDYVSPATKLQKHVRRELGLLGPLTPVQLAQLRTLDMTLELGDETEEVLEVPVAVGPYLSWARCHSILSWRSQTEEYERDWDAEVLTTFAKTTV